MSHRDRLLVLLVERSVKLGDFTLASGARSSYYVDARRTTMCAEGQYLTGIVVLDAIRARDLRPTHVGGLTMGADPLAYSIAHRSWEDGPPVDAFSVRKQAKGHGTGQRVEGGLPAGAAALVIEDSTTTGGSALQAIEAVEEAGASVIGVLTLVDREEGAGQRIREAGYPFFSIFSAAELLRVAKGSRPAAG